MPRKVRQSTRAQAAAGAMISDSGVAVGIEGMSRMPAEIEWP